MSNINQKCYKIDFSKKQLVKFLLPNYNVLREGRWPDTRTWYHHPVYEEPHRRKYLQFENPKLIADELDERLFRLGRYSHIPERLFCHNEWKSSIARRHKIDLDQFDIELDFIIEYLSGLRRKKDDYFNWRRKRKYDIKNRIKSDAQTSQKY